MSLHEYILEKIKNIILKNFSNVKIINRYQYFINCPFCGRSKHNRPHLGINLKLNAFNCFRCNTSGNLYELFSYTNDYQSALMLLNELYIMLKKQHNYLESSEFDYSIIKKELINSFFSEVENLNNIEILKYISSRILLYNQELIDFLDNLKNAGLYIMQSNKNKNCFVWNSYDYTRMFIRCSINNFRYFRVKKINDQGVSFSAINLNKYDKDKKDVNVYIGEGLFTVLTIYLIHSFFCINDSLYFIANGKSNIKHVINYILHNLNAKEINIFFLHENDLTIKFYNDLIAYLDKKIRVMKKNAIFKFSILYTRNQIENESIKDLNDEFIEIAKQLLNENKQEIYAKIMKNLKIKTLYSY